MPTQMEAAQDLYDKLRPSARRAARDYVLTRTPAFLQEEMVAVFEADLQGAADEIAPPTVIDAPLIWQEGAGAGSMLTCTLGNWYGSPNTRTYQWQLDGVDVDGATEATYTVLLADIGKTATCIMVATNIAGDSDPVTSNTITVA